MSILLRRIGRRAALPGLAVFSFLSLSALAASVPGSPAAQERDQSEIFQAMATGHADFRKAVLAEFQRVATKRNQKLDYKSLIITSCSDACMFAGLAASRLPEKPAEPPAGAEKLDTREPLGLVAVAGSFLSVRSRTIDAAGPSGQAGGGRDAGAVGTVQLRPGFYVVRHGPRANLLELVNLEQQVAVTIPYQPGPAAKDGEKRGPRGAPDAQGELAESSAWPLVFMEILHAVDLGASK